MKKDVCGKKETAFDSYYGDNRILQYDGGQRACETIRPVYMRGAAEVVQSFKSLDWSFAEDDTGYLSHDIHPYPAKFAPQLPEQVMRLLSAAGETIWDPFGGSGTTALEALLNNRSCISTDINPVGNIIGKAKTTALHTADEQELDGFMETLAYYAEHTAYLAEFIRSHKDALEKEVPDIPNLEKWFCSCVICELAFIKYVIGKELHTEAGSNLAKASLSKIITRVSNQESETTYRAVQKDFRAGDVIGFFLKDMRTNYDKVKALSALIGYRSCRFLTADVMQPVVGEGLPIQNGEVDLIVTSPPYPNAFDYHLYHRFRIFWLGEDPRLMGKAEIGSHLKYQRQKSTFQQFEEEMTPVLKNCMKALKAGRYAVFVLGNAVFDGVEYPTAERIGTLAEELGFEKIAVMDRPLPENRRSVKSWARRATMEQLLLLKKPEAEVGVTLIPAPYKLWPYEKKMSDLERKALADVDADTFAVSPYGVNALKKLTFYQGFLYEGSRLETWQNTLEHGEEDGPNRKDPKYLTHGIHPYKGKFYPQLVRPLLNILKIPEGGVVFDPFCGSGTVALESVLNGYDAYGCDVNPVAVEIATAKNTVFTVSPYEFEKHIAVFLRGLSRYEEGDYTRAFAPDAMDEIRSWFPDNVISKMGFLLTQIDSVPDERMKCFLRVILSSIIREISQQDPSDLRIRRRKEAISDAPVFEMYTKNLQKQYRNIMAYYKVRNLAPNPIGRAVIWRGNATKTADMTSHLPGSGVDVVITSPPYATALPYIDTNRLNMLILDGLHASRRVPIEAEMTGTREITKTCRVSYEQKIEAGDFEGIGSALAREIVGKIHAQNSAADVGFRRKNMAALLYMYFRDMSCVMRGLHRVVKPGGYICIVIGDTRTTTGQERIVIRTTEVLRETAGLLGWKTIQDIPIHVTVERYIHMNHSITENNILVFQKP